MRHALLVLLTLLCTLSAATADPDIAAFLTEKGDAELKKKKWDAAIEQFEKATEEEADWVPALLGLGEAWFGKGEKATAAEYFFQVLAIAAEDPKAVEETQRNQAERRLEDIDDKAYALRSQRATYIRDLMELAESVKEKDPIAALRAAERVLAVKPDHEEAAALVAELSGEDSGRAGEPGDSTSLAAKGLESWLHKEGDVWKVEGKALTTDARSGFASNVITARKFNGAYTLEGSFSVSDTKDTWQAGIVFGCHDDGSCILFAVENDGKARIYVYTPGKELEPLYSEDVRFDENKANRISAVVTPEKVIFKLNGKTIFDRGSTAERGSGYGGVFANGTRLSVKNFEVKE
jgi:tetratricopeptide (TPR) repeat protein